MSDPTPIRDPHVAHMLHAVFGAVDTDDKRHIAIKKAGVETIEDLMCMSKEDWREIDTQIAVANQFENLRFWCADYLKHPDDIFALDQDAFAKYRRERQKSQSTSRAPTKSPIADGPTMFTATDEVRKHIKRDPKAYPIFKDKKKFNPWYRMFAAIAQAQGCADVLDPEYKPALQPQQAMFEAAQAFIFAVLTSTLLEPSAAALVRKYSGKVAKHPGNAQMLHAELVTKFTQGITADSMRTSIENEIISLKLDDSWSQSISAFLTHFEHLVQDLIELCPNSDKTSYGNLWCINRLKSCLSHHPEMWSHVSSMASSRASLTLFAGSSASILPLEYHEYLVHIQAHATLLDEAQARRSRERIVSIANVGGDLDPVHEDDEAVYNPDHEAQYSDHGSDTDNHTEPDDSAYGHDDNYNEDNTHAEDDYFDDFDAYAEDEAFGNHDSNVDYNANALYTHADYDTEYDSYTDASAYDYDDDDDDAYGEDDAYADEDAADYYAEDEDVGDDDANF